MNATAEQLHESPQAGARRLAESALRDGFVPEALHCSTDADGMPVYYRIRLKHPKTGEKWIRPMHLVGACYVMGEPEFPNGKPLYNLHLITAAPPDQPVFVVEGEWCADHLVKCGVLATTSGGASSAEKADWQPLAGRSDVRVWPDHDEAGHRYGADATRCLRAVGAVVRVLDVGALGLPEKGDAVDWLAAYPTANADGVLNLPLTKLTEGASVSYGSAPGNARAKNSEEWPTPQPLPVTLAPVPPFPDDLLPERLRPWVADIAERMQCPVDFVAVPVMVALGSLIGRSIGIRPQARTDWTVVPNQWGCMIGRPGVKKSPSMDAGLAPMDQLAARAREEYAKAVQEAELKAEVEELRTKAAHREASKLLAGDLKADVTHLLARSTNDTGAPLARRYSTHDTSYQKLGEILIENPRGILVIRDELVSLLRGLDDERRTEERGFYLSGWNGTGNYTFDRIGRGANLHVPGLCIGLIGTTQPGRIAAYVRDAMRETAADDGLIQRFGLLVWPDVSGDFREVDRWPDNDAKREAFKVFETLDKLSAAAVGAAQDTDHRGEPEGIPYLRLVPEALEAFSAWHVTLERELRAGDLTPALESHFAKYRKLVPALALTCHLADAGTGPVTLEAVLRAIAWSEYLAPHARRVYGSAPTGAVTAARAILSRLRSGGLAPSFTARDIYRKQWAGLSDRDTVREALEMLEDHNYVKSTSVPTEGRWSTVYTVNPTALR